MTAGRSSGPTTKTNDPYVDTKDDIRHTYSKCTGEMPSYEKCLRKELQCGGYHSHKTLMRQGEAAAPRNTINNLPASEITRYVEQQLRTIGGRDLRLDPSGWSRPAK